MNKKAKKGGTGKAKGVNVDAKMSSAVNAADTDTGHIDQIRDIIFGSQMSDYDKRFSNLEDRIYSQIDDLRTYMDKKLDAMKNDLNKQYETLNKRLQGEAEDRGQENNALSTALDALSEQQREEVKQLSDRLMEMSSQFSDELHTQQVEASKNLDNAIQELDKAKLARETLSEMLKEVADRISNEKN